MPAEASGIPPQPPGVIRQQQGSPMSQIAKRKASGQEGQAQQMPPDKEFVANKFQSIAQDLAGIAKVLEVSNPELMPLVQRMAGAGKVLEEEFKKASQGPGSNLPQGPQPPQSSDTGDGGPGAMGL